MALPKVGDGEQIGDGNTNETLNVGRATQLVQVGGTAGTIGFYGATPVVKAAAIAAPTDLASSIVAINAIRVALTNLGLTA